MSPQEAVNEYLSDKETEVTDSTYANHKHRLRVFLQWYDANDLEDMNDIRSRDLHEFKKWRADKVKPITLKNNLGTVRLFLQFCERLDVAPMGINQRLAMPDIGREDEVRETMITKGEAERILDYCDRFEYASLRQVIFYLLCTLG